MPVTRLTSRVAWPSCRQVARSLYICLAVAALALLLLALASCGGSSTVTPPPTSVDISRTVPAQLQGRPWYFLPFDKSFSDPAAVQAFYAQTLAQPHFAVTPGITNGCGPQLVPYQLTFRHDTTIILAGTVTIGNCGVLDITTEQGQPAHDVRAYDSAYQADLAQVLGITVEDLYPTFHQYPPPATLPTAGH
jgi:hypothetical protein